MEGNTKVRWHKHDEIKYEEEGGGGRRRREREGGEEEGRREREVLENTASFTVAEPTRSICNDVVVDLYTHKENARPAAVNRFNLGVSPNEWD